MVKKFYIYDNHIGGFFYSEVKLRKSQRYCEACNDEDVLLVAASSKEELLEWLPSSKNVSLQNGIVFLDFVKTIPFDES